MVTDKKKMIYSLIAWLTESIRNKYKIAIKIYIEMKIEKFLMKISMIKI